MKQKNVPNCVFFAACDIPQVLPAYLIFVDRLLSLLQCVTWGFRLSYGKGVRNMMSRTSWKCLMIGAVVAVVISAVAPQANAQCCGYYRPVAWGCCYAPRCAPACYSPCYATYAAVGCCGASYYDSDWYLGVRPGPVRRLVLGPYRWYRAGYGCGCGYGCGYDYDYSPCCTDTPMTGSQGTVTPPSPTPTPAKKPIVEPPTEMPAGPMPNEPGPGPVPPPTTPPPVKTSEMSFENSGVLTVWVPYDAKVTINGLVTKSTGSRRQFVSYGLKPGLSYKYVVKAELVRDGQTVEDSPPTRTVNLTAGQITAVAFGFNLTPPEQVAASK